MKAAATKLELCAPNQSGVGSRVYLVLPILALLAFCLAGCQEIQPHYAPVPADASPAVTSSAVPATPPVGVTPPGATPLASTKIQEGDVLRVTFEAETNLNAMVKVQLDGSITLPLVGEVKAAGKTSPELQTDLMQRYERLLKVNQLSVAIFTSAASVYVSGAVLRPGRIPMERPLTALDAIMEAGGFDYQRAKPSGVTVLRLENGEQRHYPVNLKKALEGKDPAPFYLKPFDTVHVPEKRFNL